MRGNKRFSKVEMRAQNATKRGWRFSVIKADPDSGFATALPPISGLGIMWAVILKAKAQDFH